MATYVNYDNAGNVIGVSRFFADGIAIETANTIKVSKSLGNVTDGELLSSYKVLDRELVFVGKAPGVLYKWSLQNRAWELDLTAAKLAKKQDAKTARDLQEFGPFTYSGMIFDGDLDAQRRLSALASAAKTSLAAGYSFTKDFTLADNSVVQLTAEDFVGIEMAKLWQVETAFAEYREKKAQIEAATTLEQLEAL